MSRYYDRAGNEIDMMSWASFQRIGTDGLMERRLLRRSLVLEDDLPGEVEVLGSEQHGLDEPVLVGVVDLPEYPESIRPRVVFVPSEVRLRLLDECPSDMTARSTASTRNIKRNTAGRSSSRSRTHRSSSTLATERVTPRLLPPQTAQ